MTIEIQHYFTLFDDHFGDFDTETYEWFLNPVVTPTAIKHIRDTYGLAKDVATYNAVFNRVHKATLDYLTVNFAGRHTGRRFLLALQDEMAGQTPLDYNTEHLRKVLHQIEFKCSDFIQHHPYAKASLLRSRHHFHSEALNVLPSSLVYFKTDAIQINHLDQHQIFAYLHQKTAER
ncbi:MAG: DsbA family protein [Streptococcaceae bacterium]|jgi:hypothetical protein|nr:DsbA family protein [Streptococcaceae bacterium]